MKKQCLLAASLMIMPLTFTGCATAPHRVADSGNLLTTTNDVNIQDWDQAANQISQAVIGSGKLATVPGAMVVLGISQFRNDTTDPSLQIPVLIDKICTALTDSGKAQAEAFDPVARQAAIANAKANGAPPPPAPDFTLDGSVTQVKASEGRTRQSTFIFHLRLNSTRTGTTVWQGETQITKQDTRGAIGL